MYGLSLADGLIRGGAIKRVLLLTAETYSKYIHEGDRSLRRIFRRSHAATLIDAADEPSLTAFQFGTDGTGADTLLCTGRGPAARGRCHQAAAPAALGKRTCTWMVQSLINFTVTAVPQLIDDILRAANLSMSTIDLFLFHQATRKMLDQLRERLDLPEERMPLRMEHCGNTVSSTIPILIDALRKEGKLHGRMRT